LANKGQRRYEYAAADPVNGMDPTGNEDIVEWALLIHFPPLILWHPKLDWCGLPIVGSYLPGCGKPGPGALPPPPPPCKTKADLGKQYILAVIFDTGGTKKEMNDKALSDSGAWDVRSVNYSLQSNPQPGQRGTSASFCTCAITEHQSATQLTVGNGTEYNGLFEDNIGPHGSTTGFIHSSRFYTVVLDGSNIGEVLIMDRFGQHMVDDIQIDSLAGTTKLNGHVDPTDIQ
jgi:hypothetical protein